MPRTIAGVLLAVAAFAQGACRPSPEPTRPQAGDTSSTSETVATGPGWKPARFARAAEGCTQTWSCDCSDVRPRSGCHVEPTPEATTDGACAADRGALSGCTRCLALQPDRECTCKNVCP